MPGRRRRGTARRPRRALTADEYLRLQCEALDEPRRERVIDVAAVEEELLFASHPSVVDDEAPPPARDDA